MSIRINVRSKRKPVTFFKGGATFKTLWCSHRSTCFVRLKMHQIYFRSQGRLAWEGVEFKRG